MKALEKKYVIELSEKEINTIAAALHNEYLDKRMEYKEKGGTELCDTVSSLREIRNFMGSMIGRSWMGQDA